MSRSLNEERFNRQIRYAPFGPEGQKHLAAASAVVVGCGALGTVVASLLTRAGIGNLRIIDRDFVEESNLQRQVLYTEEDAANRIPKAEAARHHLLQANSRVIIEACVTDLNPESAADLLHADAILDATDNFETRYLINDYSVRENIPWIYGAAIGAYGITMPLLPGISPDAGPCFRCIYPDPPTGAQPTCETAGILGPITSLIASIQAIEAIKILSGHCSAVRRKIFTADLWHGPIRETPQPDRSPDCPACAHREFTWLNGRRAPVSLCGRNAVQIHERERPLDLAALARTLEGLGEVRANEFALRFTDGTHEITAFPDGRAIIKGTTDVGLARSLYSRFIGN